MKVVAYVLGVLCIIAAIVYFVISFVASFGVRRLQARIAIVR